MAPDITTTYMFLDKAARKALRTKLNNALEENSNNLKTFEEKIQQAINEPKTPLSAINASIALRNELHDIVKSLQYDLDQIARFEKNGETDNGKSIAISTAGQGITQLRTRDAKMTFPDGALNYADIEKAFNSNNFQEVKPNKTKK